MLWVGGQTEHSHNMNRTTGPSEAGAEGAAAPPNNLLKFADFENEKDCKSQGRKNEDSNLYIFEEATRIYQKCNTF